MARKERTYTEAEVTTALCAYLRTGSLRQAEKETGIPWETIRGWKGHEKWRGLLADIRRSLDEEIKRMWAASARDAAEGLQEAILRCRQSLRRPDLKDRDAALIGRTLVDVLNTTQRLLQEEPQERQPLQVVVYRGVPVPRNADERAGLNREGVSVTSRTRAPTPSPGPLGARGKTR